MNYSMISNLKTSSELLRKIKEAANKPMTSAEIKEQRVSFIVGSIDPDNGVSRERVKEILAEQEGS